MAEKYLTIQVISSVKETLVARKLKKESELGKKISWNKYLLEATA